MQLPSHAEQSESPPDPPQQQSGEHDAALEAAPHVHAAQPAAIEPHDDEEVHGALSIFWHYFVPVLIIVGGVAGFFLLKSLKKPPASVKRPVETPQVETVVVQRNTTGMQIVADGEIVPFREVTLAAEVAGRVLEKTENCRAGRYAKEGDLLLTIDPSDYQLAVRRLEEQWKRANDSLDELDVEERNTAALIELADDTLELTKRETARVRDLNRRGVLTQSELDTALREELNARNSRQSLVNQQRLFTSRRNGLLREKERILTELEQAKLNLNRTKVAAPISGVVMRANVEEDAYVQLGTELVQIEDTSKVEVRFDLRLGRLRWLWQQSGGIGAFALGQQGGSYDLPNVPVAVILDLDGQKFRWRGHLSRYDGAGINPVTRTVTCLAVVPNPRSAELVGEDSGSLDMPAPPTLLRGMFVTVKIRLPAESPLLEIPEVAIHPGNKVWIYRDGKLDIERVEVAQTLDGTALIVAKSGLDAGDEVIVTPLAVAVENMDLKKRGSSSDAKADKTVASSSVADGTGRAKSSDVTPAGTTSTIVTSE